MEVSFYSLDLKKPELYDYVINEFYPRGSNNLLIDYKCFSKVKVEDYIRVLFEGEIKYGRLIFLKENDNKIKMTFVRFINKITSNNSKIIGYELTGTKTAIYKIML